MSPLWWTLPAEWPKGTCVVRVTFLHIYPGSSGYVVWSTKLNSDVRRVSCSLWLLSRPKEYTEARRTIQIFNPISCFFAQERGLAFLPPVKRRCLFPFLPFQGKSPATGTAIWSKQGQMTTGSSRVHSRYFRMHLDASGSIRLALSRRKNAAASGGRLWPWPGVEIFGAYEPVQLLGVLGAPPLTWSRAATVVVVLPCR